jgi:hypothetical protein
MGCGGIAARAKTAHVQDGRPPRVQPPEFRKTTHGETDNTGSRHNPGCPWLVMRPSLTATAARNQARQREAEELLRTLDIRMLRDLR